MNLAFGDFIGKSDEVVRQRRGRMVVEEQRWGAEMPIPLSHPLLPNPQ
jgi:hypothetical protein